METSSIKATFFTLLCDCKGIDKVCELQGHPRRTEGEHKMQRGEKKKKGNIVRLYEIVCCHGAKKKKKHWHVCQFMKIKYNINL